jgi:hypothetical protein
MCRNPGETRGENAGGERFPAILDAHVIRRKLAKQRRIFRRRYA